MTIVKGSAAYFIIGNIEKVVETKKFIYRKKSQWSLDNTSIFIDPAEYTLDEFFQVIIQTIKAEPETEFDRLPIEDTLWYKKIVIAEPNCSEKDLAIDSDLKAIMDEIDSFVTLIICVEE